MSFSDSELLVSAVSLKKVLIKKILKHQMDPSFSKITTKTFDSMVYYTVWSPTGDGRRDARDGRRETGNWRGFSDVISENLAVFGCWKN